MAFVREDEDEEQRPGEGNTQLSSAGGQVITGQSAPTPTSSNPQGSGRFQNLQNYLNVNREQAGEFGGQIAGKLSQGVDEAKNTLNTEVDKFGQEVDAGTVKWDPTFADTSTQDILGDEEKAERYRQGKSGQYGGPQDFTSNEGITRLNQAGERVDNTKSFAGMQSTVRDVLTPKAQNYSRGEQTLDSVFLTRPKENRERFAGLRSTVSAEVPKAVETAQGRAQDFVKQGIEASKLASDDYRADFDRRTQGVQEQINAEVERQNKLRRQRYEEEQRRLAEQGSGFDDWDNFAYDQSSTPGIAGRRENFNPSGYIEYGGDLQGANVLTDDQIAELRALEQLSDPEYWSNPFAGGRQEAGDAFTFNEAAFQQDQQKYDQLGNQLQQAYSQAIEQVSLNQPDLLAAETSYNNLKNQPLPPNPYGFRTYGDYLASIGVYSGADMMQNPNTAPEPTSIDGESRFSLTST